MTGVMAVMLVACGKRPSEKVLSHTGKEASCPYVTHDIRGNTVVSWVEQDSGSAGMMYYAVTNDNGYTFSYPQSIPATAGVFPHAENLPKLLFKPDGSIIALFGVEQHDPRNKYAGKVMYAQSFDNGKTWQDAVPLVTDTSGYDQRYFDIALLPNGEAAAIWLDNRKHTKAEGSTLFFATTKGRQGFREAKPVAETVCQCCRTKLYVAPDGAIHVAYRDIINDSIRDMVHQVSVDNGATFSAPVRISADNWVVNGCPHTGPTLAASGKGLHFAWFTMGGGQGVFYCRSEDNGNTYTQKESLSKIPMAKHPQLTPCHDSDILIAWDEPVKYHNDFKSRISYVCKSANGETLKSGQLTEDSTYAVFPVVGMLRNQAAIIVYKRERKGRGEVAYQLLP